MRQQYHHRKVGEDVYIWDVNKLVQIAQNMPVVEIELTDIAELDETFWYSDRDGNQPTCRSISDHAKVIEETDLKYPILLCHEKRVIDGMHRVCKAYMQGVSSVKAVVFNPLPKPDYKNVSLKDLPYE